MNPPEQAALNDPRDRYEQHGARSMIAKTRNSAKALLSRTPAFKRLESNSTIHEQQTPSRTSTASGNNRKSFEAAYVETPQHETRKKDTYQEIELDPWLQVEGSSALINNSSPSPEIVRSKEPRKRRDSTFRARAVHSLHNWWQEWVLLFTALIILMTIVVILRVLSGQPQPEWKLGVNLNTLIAVLATVFRSSLVTIVEEGRGPAPHLRISINE